MYDAPQSPGQHSTPVKVDAHCVSSSRAAPVVVLKLPKAGEPGAAASPQASSQPCVTHEYSPPSLAL